MTISGFTYVTRLPPSHSGVALYAADFRGVLEAIAPTRVVVMPPHASESQRLAVIARTARRTLHASERGPAHVIAIELAGRGLAEFWTAFLVGRRRRLWVTVHDTPAVSGGAFFLALLDRRVGRRVAAALSKHLGFRAERAMLQRAERVYCLSAGGARQLAATFRLTRPVLDLPHVARATATPVDARRSVFMPGYLDGVENVMPTLMAISDASPEWAVEVGACGDETTRAVLACADDVGVRHRVRMLGYVDEDALDDAFERAAVVVRWKRAGWGDHGRGGTGAVSGPLIRAMAHGCAIVTNDTRGIVETLEESGAVRVGAGDEGADQCRSAVTSLIADAARREAIGDASRAHVRRFHAPSVVARRLVGD